MSIDPELKKQLDLQLIEGSISEDEYKTKLNLISENEVLALSSEASVKQKKNRTSRNKKLFICLIVAALFMIGGGCFILLGVSVHKETNANGKAMGRASDEAVAVKMRENQEAKEMLRKFKGIWYAPSPNIMYLLRINNSGEATMECWEGLTQGGTTRNGKDISEVYRFAKSGFHNVEVIKPSIRKNQTGVIIKWQTRYYGKFIGLLEFRGDDCLCADGNCSEGGSLFLVFERYTHEIQSNGRPTKYYTK